MFSNFCSFFLVDQIIGVDMRLAFGTKISLRLCSYFFVCTISCCSLREFQQNHRCQEPLMFFFIFGGPLGTCIGGTNTPVYGIVRRLLGWNSSVFRGDEVDIYLMWSLHPRCFVPLFFALLWSNWAYLEAARRNGDNEWCELHPQILFLFLGRHILLSAHYPLSAQPCIQQ